MLRLCIVRALCHVWCVSDLGTVPCCALQELEDLSVKQALRDSEMQQILAETARLHELHKASRM